MNCKQMLDFIERGELDAKLVHLYGESELDSAKARYSDLIGKFSELYGAQRDISIYSVAGRSEISGNHTDHNHGCVVAASINLDIIAVAAKRDDGIIHLKSAGFAEDCVDIAAYHEPRPEKFGKSVSLIAGMCRGFSDRGYKVGGFDAYTTSNILKGSGLSSSAAFEDMVGNILNYEYNDGKIDNVEIAKIAQFSENVFFDKPCGLMDQMACGVGGMIAIDFAEPKAPVIDKMSYDPSHEGYNLCIVNTGGNHADLTDDYASVPAEMKAVAAHFGKSVLREVKEEQILSSVAELRAKYGDRAGLRALHFVDENKRVALIKKALTEKKLDEFFATMIASGRSSFCYLQNVYTTKNPSEQGLSLALCLAEKYLASRGGAYRVHGGGFAGTIQAFVKESEVEGFRALMDATFGEGKCMVLRIRPEGAIKVI